MDELNLIEKAKSCDNDAKYQLFKKHQGFIKTLCFKFLSRHKNKFQIEDAENEAFIGLCNSVKSYDPSKAKFITYLTFFVKKQLDNLRKKSNIISIPKGEKVSCSCDSLNEEIDIESKNLSCLYHQDEIELVKAILGSLPDRNSKIINLRLSEISYSEISKELNIAIPKVKAIENQARRQIKSSLNKRNATIK